MARDSGEAMAQGKGGGSRPVVHARLLEDVRYVYLHGAFAEEEAIRDVAIALSIRDEAQNLDLAGGEAGGIGSWRCFHPFELGNERVHAGKGGLCAEGCECRAYLVKQVNSRVPLAAFCVQRGFREECQCSLVRRFAPLRKRK